MNIRIIFYIIGWIMECEAGLFMLPCVTALYYHERQGLAFLLVAAVEAVMGFFLVRKKPKQTTFYAKEGFITVALCWIILSIFGAAPFVITKEIPNVFNALFETVSGFTTTGASILLKVEDLSRTSLMWRSFTHWIGGMGVLVFILAILPISGGSSVYLLRAESPGPVVGKLTPKIRQTALILYAIYFAMTVILIVLLKIGGMSGFDSVTLSFGTAGTGGFGVRGTSIQSYSHFCKIVIAIFMMLFGINFNIYYFILMGRIKEALKSEELHWYLAIMAISTIFITMNILYRYHNVGMALTDAYFQVSSVMTTTGYATTDFNLWPQQSKTILVMIMFIGGCAGSTGGGIKVSRIVMLLKTIPKEIGYYIHPHSVRKLHFEGRAIEHETVRSVSVYLAIYVMIFAFSMLVLSFDKVDMVSSFTAVTATFNNIGPGLELVGPWGNYAFFSPISKLVLIFDMLAGRLELMPLLLLLSPSIWKETIDNHKKKRRKRKELEEQEHIKHWRG